MNEALRAICINWKSAAVVIFKLHTVV